MNIKIKVLMLVSLMIHSLSARYELIKHESDFFDDINKYEFSVVCFLDHPDALPLRDGMMKKNIKQLHEIMKAASDTDPFKKLLKQEVGFLFVDIKKYGLDGLAKTYQVPTDSQPYFVLCKDGKVVTKISGKIASLQGFVTKADLLQFIGSYFGNNFDGILEKKAEEQEKEREMQLARYQAYAASRYPYGGYSPYNVWGSPSGLIYTGYAQFYPYGYSYNGYAYA